MSSLTPLEQNAAPGVKYFSGVASYATRVRTPALGKGEPLYLNLGKIGDVAEVRVNGRLAGTVWYSPSRINVAPFLLPESDNSLEVRVANLWVNRLIGDKQPGAEKIAFIAAPTYRPDAPLRASGLIGPVVLERAH
jgi:hypothetical protein